MTEPTPEPAMQPLSEEQKAKLRALALDTNSLGNRHLDLNVLAEWGQRCCDSGLELWVPDVVLAEWAEHAAEIFETARSAASDERKWLARLSVEPTWPLNTRDEILEHVTSEVRSMRGVRVLDLDPDDAKEAIFDQVLLRAPGARRKSLKTGAADSAWIRTVARAADGDLETALIVSANRADIEALCERLDWTSPSIVPRLFDVPRVLTLFDPATAEQALSLCRAIITALPNDMFRPKANFDLGGSDPVSLGRELAEYVDEGLREFIQEGLLLSVDELAGVEEVIVDNDGSTFFAQLYLLGTASVQTAGVDNWGETQYEEFTIPNVLIRLRAEVNVVDGALRALSSDGGTADVFARQEAVRRPHSALHWANAALEVVPGLEVDDFPVSGGGFRSATVNGHSVEMTGEVEADRWQLSASVDGSVVAVLSCVPARYRVRGPDAFEFVLEPEVPGANPPWQFAAILLEALLAPA